MTARRQRKTCPANNKVTKSRSRNKRIKNRDSQEVYTRAYSARIPGKRQIWTRSQNSTKAEENSTHRQNRSNRSYISTGFAGHSSPPFSTATTANPLVWAAKSIKSLSSSAAGLFNPSASSNEIMGNGNKVSNKSRWWKSRRSKHHSSLAINTTDATDSSSSIYVNESTITYADCKRMLSSMFSECIFAGDIKITSSFCRSTICIVDSGTSTTQTWRPSTGTIVTYSPSNNGSHSALFSGCTFENTSFRSFRDRHGSRALTYQSQLFGDRSSTGARPTNSPDNLYETEGEESNNVGEHYLSRESDYDNEQIQQHRAANAQESDTDGVSYLYSVDKSAENRLVEEVIIGDGYEVSHLEKNNQTADTGSDISGEACASRKRKTSSPTSNAKKQNSSTARCTLCQTDFYTLKDKDEYMYSGSCGHVFCHPCIRNMSSPRHCDTCNTPILSFCQLFL